MSTLKSWSALAVVAVLCGVSAVGAQVLMQPTEPPTESAALADWFVADEPVVFNGIVYHPVGAEVFFDGDTMVRIGWFEGTPLYVDTTIEPNSVVLVPVGGRMMQPFERVRDREVAGTTGSRAPWFPVRPAVSESAWGSGAEAPAPWGLSETAMAAGPPIAWESAPYSSLLGRMVTERPVAGRRAIVPSGVPGAVGTVGTRAAAPVITPPRPLFVPGAVHTVRAADATLGVWIDYEGARWQACGSAEPFAPERFQQRGTYRGFPVYSRQGVPGGQRIYLPTREGFVAPYVRGPVELKPAGGCASPVIG